MKPPIQSMKTPLPLLFRLLFLDVLKNQWAALFAATVSVSLAIGLALSIRLGTQSARLSLDQNLKAFESNEAWGPIRVREGSRSEGELGRLSEGRKMRMSRTIQAKVEGDKMVSVALIWSNTFDSEFGKLSESSFRSEARLFAPPKCWPDKVTVALGSTVTTLPVTEISELQASPCSVAFASGPLWASLFPLEATSPNEVVVEKLSTDDEDFATDLQTSLQLSQNLEWIPRKAQVGDLDKLTSSLNTNLQIMGFVAIFIGLFMVHHVFTLVLTRNAKSLAVLSALGIGLRRWLPSLLLLACFLGAVSSFLGCVFGWILGAALSKITQATVQSLYEPRLDPSVFTYASIDFVYAFVLGMGACFVGSLGPIWRLRNLETADVLRTGMWHEASRPKGHELRNTLLVWVGCAGALFLLLRFPIVYQRLPLGAFLACLILLLWATHLARFLTLELGNISRFFKGNYSELKIFIPPQSAIVVQVLSLCFALTLSVKIMSESFRVSLEEWVSETLKADIWVRSTSKTRVELPDKLVQTLDRLPSATAVDGLRVLRASLERADGTSFPIAAKAVRLGEQAKVEPLKLIGGGSHAPNQAQSSEAMAKNLLPCGQTESSPCPAYISLPLSIHTKVARQDVFRVKIEGRTLYYRAWEVFQDFSNDEGSFLTDVKILESHIQEPLVPNFMNVYLKDKDQLAKSLEYINGAAKDIEDLEVLTLKDLRQQIREAFERTFRITDALYLLCGGVAFVTVLSSLGLQILLRSQEWSILWATTWDRRLLSRKLSFWAGHQGLWSVLLSLPGGIATGLILVYVVNLYSFGFQLAFVFPWEFALLLFPLAWFVGAFAGKLLSVSLVKNLSVQQLTPE